MTATKKFAAATVILLMFLASSARLAEATTVLIDVNSALVDAAAPDGNGNYWNAITNDTGAVVPLVSTSNGATPWTVALTELSPATSAGFSGSPIETGPAPGNFNVAQAYQDAWFDNTTGESVGEFAFAGLDTSLDYTLTLYGDRDTGWADGNIVVTGGTATGGPNFTLSQGVLLNLTIFPTLGGDFSFTIDDSGGPGSNVVLNAFSLTGTVPVPEPTTLLLGVVGICFGLCCRMRRLRGVESSRF